MLVAIIALFTICWGPTLIDQVLVAFGLIEQLHYGHLKPMRMAFALMAYSNSCVNPIVYALMSKNFRQCFHSTFLSLIRRSRKEGDNTVRRDSYISYNARRASATTLTSVRPTFVKMDSGTFLAVKELKETSLAHPSSRKTSVSAPPGVNNIYEENWVA